MAGRHRRRRSDIDRVDRATVSAESPLYRGASVAVGAYVLFAGGTDNPYNYDGQGYDGRPSEPRDGVFAYDVEQGAWIEFPNLAVPTLDHRAIVLAAQYLIIAGGMEAGQRVTNRTQMVSISQVLKR